MSQTGRLKSHSNALLLFSFKSHYDSARIDPSLTLRVEMWRRSNVSHSGGPNPLGFPLPSITHFWALQSRLVFRAKRRLGAFAPNAVSES